MTAADLDLTTILNALRERAAEQSRDGPAGAAANGIAFTAYGWLGDNIGAFIADIGTSPASAAAALEHCTMEALRNRIATILVPFSYGAFELQLDASGARVQPALQPNAHAFRAADAVLEALSAEALAPSISDRDRLAAVADECWDNLINKDDRNSPEDYPEMALITRDELADYIARAEFPTARAAPAADTAPPVDWRDDPSADERWNAGVDFAQQKLCRVLGVNPVVVNWDAATETLDGDVEAVISNILTLAMGERWRPDPSDHQRSHDADFAAHRESEASRFVIACLRMTTNGRLPHALLVDYLRRAFLLPTPKEIATTFERMEAEGLVSVSLPVVELTEKGARS